MQIHSLLNQILILYIIGLIILAVLACIVFIFIEAPKGKKEGFYKQKRFYIPFISTLIAIPVLIMLGFLYNNSLSPQEKSRQELSQIATEINAPGKLIVDGPVRSNCQSTSVGLEKRNYCANTYEKFFLNDSNEDEDRVHIEELIEVNESWWQDLQIGAIVYTSSSHQPSDLESLLKPYNDKLKDGEYIYGVSLGQNYWSCNEGFLDPIPCPAPPQ